MVISDMDGRSGGLGQDGVEGSVSVEVLDRNGAMTGTDGDGKE